MIGETISHYRILAKLGEGGMGVVYKAADTKLGRTVALKVLKPEYVGDEEYRQRFLREARSAAAVTHPYIAAIHDADEADGTLFIAMEYVEGVTLRALLHEGTVPLSVAQRFAVEIAEGLAKAHTNQIIHRDLKPDNVMIGNDGHVKILDFGLAKLLERRDETTATQVGGLPTVQGTVTVRGEILGTPAYMSPEQVRGQAVDARSDVFAFGSTLYEMLTGRAAFRGATAQDTLAAVLLEDPPSASDINPQISRELDQILARTLQKDPAARYQNTQDLVADLNRSWHMSERRTAAATTVTLSEVTKMRPWLVRSRIGKILAVGMAIVLIAIGALWGISQLTDRSQRSLSPAGGSAGVPAIAVFPFSYRGSAESAYLAQGMVELLSNKLNVEGQLRSVDPKTLTRIVARDVEGEADPQQARKITEWFGADLFILGSIVQTGDWLQLSASLYEVQKGLDPLATESVEGKADTIQNLVDQLTMRLLSSRFTEPAARMARVATTTTSSLPALKAFLEGESLCQADRFLEAVQAYQRAVAADSTFALAWLRLFETVDYSPEASTSGVDQEHAIQQAMRYRDRLPARDRMNVEATNLSRVWTGNAPTAENLHEAERLMRTILDHHPDDAEAWRGYGVGLHFFAPYWGRSLQESRQALERAIELGDPYAEGHLVGVYAKLDLRAKADSIMRQCQVAEGGDWALDTQVEIAYSLKDSVVQAQLRSELEKLGDGKLWWCTLAAGHSSGRPFAEYLPTSLPRLMTAPRRSDARRTYGHLFIALMQVARGQWQAAETEIDSARTIDPRSTLFIQALLVLGSIRPGANEELAALRGDMARLAGEDLGYQETYRLFLMGLLDCRLGNTPAAVACAETLAARAPSFADLETWIPRDREAKKLSHILRAEAATREGDTAGALAEIEQSPFFAPRNLGDILMHLIFGYERFRKAELLAELGRPEEALRWYDTIAMPPFSGMHEMVYIAPAHLRRAEIHDQLGQTEQATYNYRKFTEIWSDCDPELRAVVDKAAERFASLER